MDKTLTPAQQAYYLSAFSLSLLQDPVSYGGIDLYQFADVRFKASGSTAPLHTQICDEITYVSGGEGSVTVNGNSTPLCAGQFHLCHAGDTHQLYSSQSSPLRFYCLGYRIPKGSPLYGLSESVKAKSPPDSPFVIGDSMNLQPAFLSLLNVLYDADASSPYPGLSQHMIASTLGYILSSTLLAFDSPKETSRSHTASGGDALVFYITSCLKNNLYDINALSKLPQATGYSYSYLSHLFSEKTGKSLKSFFTEMRMDSAELLLKTKSVTEVAELLHYSSIHAFSKAYKNRFRHSPTGKET